MASTTTNYGWVKPVVGGDGDAWGGEINADLDGIDATVKSVSNAIPLASSTTPLMDGTAAVGTGTTWAKADHIHPTDTTRYAASNPSGYQTAANVTTSLAPYAPLASPAFTGTPSLPTGTTGVTQTAGNSTTALATTAFVATSFAPLASPAFTGAPFLPTGTIGVTQTAGNNTTALATTAFVTTALAAKPLNDNRIINGNFAINQRGQTSGTALAAAAYGHDRWKAGASGCTYTFTAAVPDTTITITAGTLTQVIEAGMIEGGVYTLSWTGTAQARVYQGTPTGSYAASPVVTASLTAGTNTIVEFNAGTLVLAKFEIGSLATPFNRQSLAKSLADCQRYYQTGGVQLAVYGAAGMGFAATQALSGSMRATPSVVSNMSTQSNCSGSAIAVSSINAVQISGNVTATGAFNCFGTYTASAEL